MQSEYIQKELYADGKYLPLGDGEIRLCHVRNRDEKHIRIYRRKQEDGSYCLCMASGIKDNPPAYRHAVTGWLREYAKVHLGEKVCQFAEKMQVTVNRITIKEQKTRWGSCSSKGNINFNWKLVLMPERIQDYIVVHELAHRKQMNHSAAFWKIVEDFLPDYKERRAWLRSHEKEYVKY